MKELILVGYNKIAVNFCLIKSSGLRKKPLRESSTTHTTINLHQCIGHKKTLS